MLFKVELVMEIPDEITDTWDSSCDETFGIAKFLNNDNPNIHIADYSQIKFEEFASKKHAIFDINGGI